jgi:hypothetical protein
MDDQIMEQGVAFKGQLQYRGSFVMKEENPYVRN